MTATRVYTPRSLDAALTALANAEPGCRVIAGGTDLMVALHAGVTSAPALVDLWKVQELRGIERKGGHLLIGALTTYSDLLGSAIIAHDLPALARASAQVGAAQIQNRGTIGGNLANASPAADLAPVLSALDAELVLASRRTGERVVSLHQFYVGYRQTCLAPDELLVAVRVPLPAPRERVLFRKVGTRAAQAISKVVLAAAVAVDAGRVTRLRVAAGSVAPTVVRLRATEAAAAGVAVPLSQPAGAALRAACNQDITPIDDVRSTAEYRRRVVANLVIRLLEGAMSS
jgi:CO/xanthine dehydrogenase FAD-binding subunit